MEESLDTATHLDGIYTYTPTSLSGVLQRNEIH